MKPPSRCATNVDQRHQNNKKSLANKQETENPEHEHIEVRTALLLLSRVHIHIFFRVKRKPVCKKNLTKRCISMLHAIFTYWWPYKCKFYFTLFSFWGWLHWDFPRFLCASGRCSNTTLSCVLLRHQCQSFSFQHGRPPDAKIPRK